MTRIVPILLFFQVLLYAQPNFVIIMADDLSPKELSCYGNTEYQTPNIDRLAKGGTKFETCYATPNCTTTRVMLLTGRYGFRTGWCDFIEDPYSPQRGSDLRDLGKNEITFADVLKTKGYRTALSGKWQLPGTPENRIYDCGFDEYFVWSWKHKIPGNKEHTGGYEKGKRASRFWHPGIIKNGEYHPTQEKDYGPDLYTDFAIDFIKRNKNNSFCLYYPMCFTHAPWEPTPDISDKSKKTQYGLRQNVEYMDHLVGKILNALEELSLENETFVLFCSDNGTEDEEKGEVLEKNVKVPLIIKYPPKIPSGVVNKELVSLVDIFSTISDFAGAEPPKNRKIDSISLKNTLLEKKHHRDWVFSYRRTKRILRSKDWYLDADGKFYKLTKEGREDVTDSQDKEVQSAYKEFMEILKNLPAPQKIEKRIDILSVAAILSLVLLTMYFFWRFRRK